MKKRAPMILAATLMLAGAVAATANSAFADTATESAETANGAPGGTEVTSAAGFVEGCGEQRLRIDHSNGESTCHSDSGEVDINATYMVSDTCRGALLSDHGDIGFGPGTSKNFTRFAGNPQVIHVHFVRIDGC